MEKKIEHYLPFYIDAIEVQCPKQIGWKHSQKRHPLTLSFLYEHRDKKLIPILRPLSSMTEEEKTEYNHRKQRKGYMAQVHADNTLWLLSKGFDIFNLESSGLAIYEMNDKPETV